MLSCSLPRPRWRRWVAVGLVGALPLVGGLGVAQSAAANPCLPDGRCLIPNPLATRDQLRLERLAVRLAGYPQVQQAKREITRDYLHAVTSVLGPVGLRSQAQLDIAMSELAFNSAEKAADNDPFRPHVLHMEAPAHRWLGQDVPGGRDGWADPDTIDRIIPVNARSHYEIRGLVHRAPPANADFLLVSDITTRTPVAALHSSELVTAPDGTFTLTVGPEPAEGRDNYLQSSPGTRQLLIRETLADGIAQTPYSLSVQRISGPSAPPSRDEAQLATDAASILRAAAADVLPFVKAALKQPATEIHSPPLPPGTPAGPATQTFLHFRLRYDQALVLTIQTGDAADVSASIRTVWAAPPPEPARDFASAQAQPNPDGTYTVVLAARDPGVSNWVDTADVREGTLLVRWRGLPEVADAAYPPAMSGRVVTLRRLSAALPTGTPMATPFQRQLQNLVSALSAARRVGGLVYTGPSDVPGMPGPLPSPASPAAPASAAAPASPTAPASACPMGPQRPDRDRLTPQAECVAQQVPTRLHAVLAVGGCCGNGSGKGDHPTGHAVDLMLDLTGRTSPQVQAHGQQIVEWLIANAVPLHIKYLGWWQRLWLPSRGWRVECSPTFTRCGLDGPPTITAMHEDHVHISVY